MRPPTKAQLFATTAVTTVALVGTAIWTQSQLGDRLLPHAYCLNTSQPLLLLHLVSDGLIALAYLLIPWALLHVVRRRPDLPFGWVAWLFGAFIVSCGLTHALEVWTLWDPVYWYAGVMKAFTAAASLATAWVLYALMPAALSLPSADQLRQANRALEREVLSRRQAETELTKAKAELELLVGAKTRQAEQSATVLHRFFENAPLGLVLLDSDLRFIRVNAGLTAATGRAAGEYANARMDTLEGMPGAAVVAARQVVQTRQAQQGLQVSRALPDARDWLVSFFPIPLGRTDLLVGGVVQDVTYQRRMEQQRIEALSAAQQANRAKDQFLAKVSHELRSPLQVALSSAEVLRRVPDMPSLGRKYVDRLSHAIGMQARMISDLLDVSRILSGKLHVANEVVDPALPLLRVLDHWTSVAQGRQIALDASTLQPGQALVEADPARLEQVYANLLDNAIRFSTPGSRVEIGASAGKGSRWRLFVRDHGVGLAREEIQEIFQPFVQGDAQPASGKGLGLGLAIVKALVEAFGGRVWAESQGAGRGATFFVELPIDLDATAPSSFLQEPEEAPRLDGLRVLYVEDQPQVASAMQDALGQLGAKVSVANSYEDALDQLKARHVDVLVSDLNLGGRRGGTDVLLAMRAMARHAGVPAIAVSAYGTQDDRRQTQAAGFTEHLVKPVDSLTVAHAIRRVAR